MHKKLQGQRNNYIIDKIYGRLRTRIQLIKIKYYQSHVRTFNKLFILLPSFIQHEYRQSTETESHCLHI